MLNECMTSMEEHILYVYECHACLKKAYEVMIDVQLSTIIMAITREQLVLLPWQN